MSTRCQIGFYSASDQPILAPEALIYKHCDGYPGDPETNEPGLLLELLPFLKEFNASRGVRDFEYCAAWTLWHLMTSDYKHSKEFHKKLQKSGLYATKPFKNDFLGFGICHDFHSDIEYLYHISPTQVKVYSVYIDSHPINPGHFTLESSFRFDGTRLPTGEIKAKEEIKAESIRETKAEAKEAAGEIQTEREIKADTIRKILQY